MGQIRARARCIIFRLLAPASSLCRWSCYMHSPGRLARLLSNEHPGAGASGILVIFSPYTRFYSCRPQCSASCAPDTLVSDPAMRLRGVRRSVACLRLCLSSALPIVCRPISMLTFTRMISDGTRHSGAVRWIGSSSTSQLTTHPTRIAC